MTRAFTLIATATISTTRPPAMSGGKRGARVTNLTAVSVVPLMPASNTTFQRAATQSASLELWETFTQVHTHTDSTVEVTQIPDIRQGDILVDNSIDYDVIWVGNYASTGGLNAYLHIVMEEVRAQ